MTESERDLGKRWFEQVWNQLRREAIAEMMAPEAVLHDGRTDTTGPEGFYPFYDRLRATLSELHVIVEDTIAEGDKICIRWSSTGKHTGGGLGIAPTGVNIHITGITVLRVGGERILEGWQNWDMLGMMEQINNLARSATYMA